MYLARQAELPFLTLGGPEPGILVEVTFDITLGQSAIDALQVNR